MTPALGASCEATIDLPIPSQKEGDLLPDPGWWGRDYGGMD